MQYQADQLIQLPPELRTQFDTLEQRLWRVDTLIAAAGACCGVLLSYALVFVSDRFWDTPTLLRLLLMAAGLGVAAWFLYGWLRLWVFQRRDSRALATLVQKHHRRLGDRLLGIVELADETKRPANVSAALCRAAIAQVTREAVKCDFRTAVATRKPKLYCLGTVVLALLVLAPFIFAPEAGANALARWIWPVSATPRFTFVNLSNLPERLVVPHGEPFELGCGVAAKPPWQPTEGRCQFDDQPVITSPIRKDRILFKIPAQTKPGILKLSVGDIRRKLQIEPTHRPQLRQLHATLSLPDYLQHGDQKQEVRNGRLSAVEGSRISFVGEVTRPLAEATLQADNTTPLTVSGASFQTPALVLNRDQRLAFAWKDTLGLEARPPFPLTLTALKDNPPSIELPEQPRQVAVLEDEVLSIKLLAGDDFGVKETSVVMDYLLPKSTSEEVRQEVRPVQAGGPQTKKLEAKYGFSPELMEFPAGTIVNLRALAVDYLPNRKPSESPIHRIFILSKEEHAKLIQEQFERLRAAIEELTRKQENLVGETRQTSEQNAEKMMTEETTKRLAEQAAEQKDFARQLERLAQEGLKTLKEASRNQAIPEQALKQWAENVGKMQEISEQEMSPASQDLQQSSQSQNQSQRSEKSKAGLKKEQKALEGLQELQKKMTKNLDDLQARGLALRLRRVAATEREIGGSLQKNLPLTIGLRKETLPPEVVRNLTGLSTEQGKAGKDTRKLQDEIERFNQRTSDEKHGEVAREMKESQAGDEIAAIAELIAENVAAQALNQTAAWSKRLEGWAEKLESRKPESSSGESQEGGNKETDEEALEKMLALVRVRDSEENLGEQTVLLEEQKTKRRNYPVDAQRLSRRQTDVREDLDALAPHPVFKKVRQRLVQAGKAMGDAATQLTKPDTGELTTSAQTDAVNLIDDALMTLLQSSQKQNPGAAAMQQMMAMRQGMKPGGNPNGGGTGQRNLTAGGDARGKPGSERTNERVSGTKTRALPSEYKEALQNYFKAIEQANP